MDTTLACFRNAITVATELPTPADSMAMMGPWSVSPGFSKLLHDAGGHVETLHGIAEGARGDDDGLKVRNAAGETWSTFCDGQLILFPGSVATAAARVPVAAIGASVLELVGGATLVFNEYGDVKYAIGDRVLDPKRREVQKRQSERLRSLLEQGHYSRPGKAVARRFSSIHRRRALSPLAQLHEEW